MSRFRITFDAHNSQAKDFLVLNYMVVLYHLIVRLPSDRRLRAVSTAFPDRPGPGCAAKRRTR